MTKYYGKLGFVETVEESPGRWIEKNIERPYKGDVVRNMRRWNIPTDKMASDISLNNSLIIVADEYLITHSPYLRYAEVAGSYWEISSIDLTDRPRCVLELGGVYNKTEDDEFSGDEETGTPEDIGDDPGES